MKAAYKIFILLSGMLLSGTGAVAQSFAYPAQTAAPAAEESPRIRYNSVISSDKASALQASQDEKQYILVFYEDFKIEHTLSGKVSSSFPN